MMGSDQPRRDRCNGSMPVSTRATSDFELDSHFGSNYAVHTPAKFHVLISWQFQHYHADEILLTQQNTQLPKY